MNCKNSREKGEKKKWAIRAAIFIVIILIILLGLYKCGHPDNQPMLGPDVIIGAGVKEGEMDRGDESDNHESRSTGKSEMTVRMNGYPVFADGGSEGSLNIENPAVNELYMNVVIMLNGTGDVIYDSGAIPPNHYIDSNRLAMVLEKGTYEATAHVTLFDPEYPDINYNSANFTLVITIEN